jgi:hypothetical protein
VLALVLAGCNESSQQSQVAGSRASPAMAAPPAMLADKAAQSEQPASGETAPKLAYTHNLSLEMAADKVAPRFERARTRCLNEPALHCALVHASISYGSAESSSPPYASITLRLPHDQIAAFQKDLLAPLPGEGKGEPVLRESTTDAEDLTYAIMDGDRRLAQLTDYRDRLLDLAKNNQAKVEDLIQIEEKISEVQSQIEQLTADQRGLNLRVDTEVLSINLSALAGIADVRSPLAEAWRNAGQVLGDSAARAFTFTVSMLPWLPLIALLVWIALRLWRLIRGKGWRKAQKAPPPA